MDEILVLTTTRKASVITASCSPIFLIGLRAALSAHATILGEASNVRQMVEQLETHPTSALVADAELLTYYLFQKIRKIRPEMKILLLETCPHKRYRRYLRRSADAYLTGQDALGQLLEALRNLQGMTPPAVSGS